MSAAAADKEALGAPRVLIIEDDPQIVRALGPSLTVSGYAVTSVRTAREAMIEIVDDGWHAVVLDLGLPDADGSDLIKPIRQTGLRVVVITARSHPETEELAMRRGAAAFLRKPFATPDLVRLIDELA